MSLLTLPTELRHQIYSHLTHPAPMSIGSDTGIFISLKPPPSTLLLSCRFLYHDVTAYFYSISTIEVSWFSVNISNCPRALTAIQQARTIEYDLMCPTDSYNPSGQDGSVVLQYRLQQEMEMFRVLIKEARHLRQVVVSTTCRCTSGAWDAQEKRLAHLKGLKEGRGELTFVAGEIEFYGGDIESRMKLEKNFKEYLQELNAKVA